MAKSHPRKHRKGKPPPKCKAILLCDTVIVDQLTGKSTVIGIFEAFAAPNFPAETVPFHLFLQLTDGIGTYQLTVEVIDLADGNVLARAELAEAHFEDRATKQVLIIPMPSLPLPHEGVYDFVVLADGQEIDRQQYESRIVEEASDENDAETNPEE